MKYVITEKVIAAAGEILSYDSGDIDVKIQKAIENIIESAAIEFPVSVDFIDYLDDVQVCEAYENTFYPVDFLNLLPFDKDNEGYFIEYNGQHWQSVFPSIESEKSQGHESAIEALEYMQTECNVMKDITVLSRESKNSKFFVNFQATFYECSEGFDVDQDLKTSFPNRNFTSSLSEANDEDEDDEGNTLETIDVFVSVEIFAATIEDAKQIAYEVLAECDESNDWFSIKDSLGNVLYEEDEE